MSTLRWALWAAVAAAVGYAAWSHRGAVEKALRVLPQANLLWLVLAMVAVAALYLCRAIVYGVPLRLLDYTVPWTFLWQTAIVASAVNQLLPAGGASSYAFLAYALHRRGVTTGQASLVALIDTLSYAFGAGTVVSAPAGGGSVEVVMSAFFARQGVDTSLAIAGTLLFRLVSFWLPVVVSGPLLLAFRRHSADIRRRRGGRRRRRVPDRSPTS